MIGVSLHFGPVATLPYWLRAHEIVQTSVRAPAVDFLKGLTIYQFSLSPPADVPVFLSTSEIGLSPRLSNIRKILGPTGRLGMLVDVDRGKQFYVRFEDRLFRMATGPIRLAQMLDAELVPVLIVEAFTWKYIPFISEVRYRNTTLVARLTCKLLVLTCYRNFRKPSLVIRSSIV